MYTFNIRFVLKMYTFGIHLCAGCMPSLNWIGKDKVVKERSFWNRKTLGGTKRDY